MKYFELFCSLNLLEEQKRKSKSIYSLILIYSCCSRIREVIREKMEKFVIFLGLF